MDPTLTFLLIALLILASAFLSLSEISMAAARRMRLLQRAAAGDSRAMSALEIQEEPGNSFTVVQIGQNMVAILGGIVGEGALTPRCTASARPRPRCRRGSPPCSGRSAPR